MARVDVLVVVNVAKAQRDNTLTNNLWMLDTNRNNLSVNEGGNVLITACSNGDSIVWNVTPLDADQSVSITGFAGDAISNGILTPRNDGDDGWHSHVNGATHSDYGALGGYQLTLSVNGQPMSLTSFIDSSPQS